jgi:hypothetical protein
MIVRTIIPRAWQRHAVAINAAIVEGLANSSLRERLADLGQQIFPRDQQTPEALAAC